MTEGVPVMLHLPVDTLRKLEAIAKRRETTVRTLIVQHLQVSLDAHEALGKRTNRTVLQDAAAALAARILELHHAGRTPSQIATGMGWTPSHVSKRPIGAGIRHRRPRTAQP